MRKLYALEYQQLSNMYRTHPELYNSCPVHEMAADEPQESENITNSSQTLPERGGDLPVYELAGVFPEFGNDLPAQPNSCFSRSYSAHTAITPETFVQNLRGFVDDLNVK